MGGDPRAGEGELRVVLADEGDAGAGVAEGPGAEDAELAVAEDGRRDGGAELDLLGDAERRGQGLDERGLAVVEGVGDRVQVPLGDRDEVGHGPVVAEDPEDGPVRAVLGASRGAGGAGVAGVVDLGGHAAAVGGLGHELVAEDAAVIHVSPSELEVGVADPRQPDLQQNFTIGHARLGEVSTQRDRPAVAIDSAHE